MGLFDFFSGDDARAAAAARAAGYQSAYNSAASAINKGLGSATDYYNQALAPYASLAGTANSAYAAYADAIGLNGPEGAARAAARFQAGPGYQFALNQGLDALDRRAAARGMLASGNNNLDTINYANGLANQQWSNYLSAFAPYLSAAPQIAGQQSDIYRGLGNLNYQSGTDLANYGFNSQVGVGNANADAAMADYNASANFWNTLLKAGQIAASFGRGAEERLEEVGLTRERPQAATHPLTRRPCGRRPLPTWER